MYLEYQELPDDDVDAALGAQVRHARAQQPLRHHKVPCVGLRGHDLLGLRGHETLDLRGYDPHRIRGNAPLGVQVRHARAQHPLGHDEIPGPHKGFS